MSLYVSPIAPESGFCVVRIDGWFFATTTGSSLQPLVKELLFESPVNEATQ